MRVGILTDTHLAPADSPPVTWHSELLFADAGDRYSRALLTLREHAPDLIVVLGDLTHFGDAPSMDDFLARSALAPCPVFVIAGNHDVVPTVDALERGLARAVPGGVSQLSRVTQVRGTMRVGEVTFLGIDLAPSDGEERYRAFVPDSAPAGAVVLSHFPVLSLAESFAGRLRYAGDLDNREQLEHVVRHEGSPTVVLCGHLHARVAEVSGAILQLTFGALIEAPFDVAIAEIELDGRHGTVRVDQLGPTADSDAAIAPRSYAYEYVAGAWTLTT